MSEPITISATKARASWSDIFNRAGYAHQPYLITKQNKPTVVMLGVDDYNGLIDTIENMKEKLGSSK